MNFIGMNLKKYFSFWKTKSISRFQLLSSRYGIKSAVVSVKAYSLSVCMAAKPVTIFHSSVYSPKLSSVLAKAKLFQSLAVRDMKRVSEFSCVHCTAFQLSYRRTAVICWESFSYPTMN